MNETKTYVTATGQKVLVRVGVLAVPPSWEVCESANGRVFIHTACGLSNISEATYPRVSKMLGRASFLLVTEKGFLKRGIEVLAGETPEVLVEKINAAIARLHLVVKRAKQIIARDKSPVAEAGAAYYFNETAMKMAEAGRKAGLLDEVFFKTAPDNFQEYKEEGGTVVWGFVQGEHVGYYDRIYYKQLPEGLRGLELVFHGNSMYDKSTGGQV